MVLGKPSPATSLGGRGGAKTIAKWPHPLRPSNNQSKYLCRLCKYNRKTSSPRLLRSTDRKKESMVAGHSMHSSPSLSVYRALPRALCRTCRFVLEVPLQAQARCDRWHPLRRCRPCIRQGTERYPNDHCTLQRIVKQPPIQVPMSPVHRSGQAVICPIGPLVLLPPEAMKETRKCVRPRPMSDLGRWTLGKLWEPEAKRGRAWPG